VSKTRKLQMSMKAASLTPTERERITTKLMRDITCPCIVVFAASGGPSTENSFICAFKTGIPGWYSNCESYGRVKACKALRDLYRRLDVRRFLALRRLQAGFSLFRPVVSGLVGSYTMEEEIDG